MCSVKYISLMFLWLRDFLLKSTTNYVSDVRHSRQTVRCEQHYTWANLGFIRSIAIGASMQRALSSEACVQLCLTLISTEHTPSGASNLPRQVWLGQAFNYIYFYLFKCILSYIFYRLILIFYLAFLSININCYLNCGLFGLF